MYIQEIFVLLGWPAVIILSLYLVIQAVKRFETKLEEED